MGKDEGSKPKNDRANQGEDSHAEESLKRALTAGPGEVYTVRKGDSSLTIGRADLLPVDETDEELDQSSYPEVPRGPNDYDTWLG